MTTQFEVARERLVSDVRAVLADAEEIVQVAASDSKDKVATLRPKVDASLQRARTRLRELEAVMESRARETAQQVDVYAHEHPWKTAGVAAGIGAAVGAIVALLLSRR